MNTYIILGYIDNIGGGEAYVNSKVEFLQNNNWNVVVFSPIKNEVERSPWPNLNNFFQNRCIELKYAPEFWSLKTRNKILDWMKLSIETTEDKIIIESNVDYLAEWGELLAEKLHAKHFCFLIDERLELYGAKEFFYFKYLRREIAGIHETSMQRLFTGYHPSTKYEGIVFQAANYGTVQDIKCPEIDKLKRLDWNIAYIGRYKQYVDNIVQDIVSFSSAYPEKQLQFIILGDIGKLRKNIPSNLNIVQLGFMIPIPKSFFNHVDVVIAGAGCAYLSHNAGALTIVADASTCMSNGILGYTTKNTLFNPDVQETFAVTLHKVFIQKLWDNLPINPLFSYSRKEIDGYFAEHLKYIEDSEQSKEYFDFITHPQKNYSVEQCVGYFMKKYTRPLYIIARKLLDNIKKNHEK